MERKNRPTVIWLSLVCGMILTMVVVGGITRLTHSGLSIVEWKPITGILPPLSEGAWQEIFQKYQASPEYLKSNLHMSLDDFKGIFFWEYLHRLLGRLAGVVFLLPYLYFLIRGKLRGGLGKRLLIGFAIAALEGPMGWFMVKSGLVDIPRVSPYRLTAHLLLAFAAFAYFFWILLEIISQSLHLGDDGVTGPPQPKLLRKISLGLIGLISLEIFYGGLTAGFKAGYEYGIFPNKMEFEDPILVKFLHLVIGTLLLSGIAAFRLYAGRFPLNGAQKWGVNLLALLAVAQVILGFYTLLHFIPVGPAVLHQGVAFLLFGTAIFVCHSFSKIRN